jgi:hypothetical protein
MIRAGIPKPETRDDYEGGYFRDSAGVLKVTGGKPDNVNHPQHYTEGGIETIDYMKAKATPEEFKGYLKLNAIKYLSRANIIWSKNEDYKKAQWYINRLVNELGE